MISQDIDPASFWTMVMGAVIFVPLGIFILVAGGIETYRELKAWRSEQHPLADMREHHRDIAQAAGIHPKNTPHIPK